MAQMHGSTETAADLGVMGQIMGLALLRAEMEALAQMMPGRSHETEAETAARLAAVDAEVEAAFDNMPV